MAYPDLFPIAELISASMTISRDEALGDALNSGIPGTTNDSCRPSKSVSSSPTLHSARHFSRPWQVHQNPRLDQMVWSRLGSQTKGLSAVTAGVRIPT
ncbi:hypothetical protein L210DRAFT_953828 [Boletus edulis BED1]|uniref:Uncharacterized protein n=1 Tax=Boletus edulis BED1 TaxID=1328754 RepID=A0AAD4G6Y3_BOLED|nr:hypothetical protein L210DRAFT_953828 [Boletus edulis BED1]